MLKIVNKILIVKTMTKNKGITYMSLVVYYIYSLGLDEGFFMWAYAIFPWARQDYCLHYHLSSVIFPLILSKDFPYWLRPFFCGPDRIVIYILSFK